ncbi:MAG TPA: hypothetical protein VIL46_00355 [Gemmataceae bacterium]
MEPACDVAALADRSRPLGEHQEGGLEGVLRVVLAAQQPAADGQHHRPVPLQKRPEGVGVAAAGEAVEEVAVALVGGQGDFPEELLSGPDRRGRHGAPSEGENDVPTQVVRPGWCGGLESRLQPACQPRAG